MPAPAEGSLDRLIEALYGCVVEYADEAFRPAMLQRLCAWSGAGAAAWLTQTAQGQDVGYAAWPAPIARDAIEAIAFPPGQRSVEPDTRTPGWQLGGRCAGAALAFRLVHRGTPMHSVVLLLFESAAPAAEALLRALGHLVQAGSLSLLQLVQRDEWLQAMGRSSRGAAALVDDSGRIVLASRRFVELLRAAPNEDADRVLPFPLPVAAVAAGRGEFSFDGLHFRLQRSGSLLLLHARRPHPLDALSPREQQIARALAAGKTFKTIARDYDIAISTVANHASRIYRKLGLYRREELAGLLRKALAG